MCSLRRSLFPCLYYSCVFSDKAGLPCLPRKGLAKTLGSRLGGRSIHLAVCSRKKSGSSQQTRSPREYSPGPLGSICLDVGRGVPYGLGYSSKPHPEVSHPGVSHDVFNASSFVRGCVELTGPRRLFLRRFRRRGTVCGFSVEFALIILFGPKVGFISIEKLWKFDLATARKNGNKNTTVAHLDISQRALTVPLSGKTAVTRLVTRTVRIISCSWSAGMRLVKSKWLAILMERVAINSTFDIKSSEMEDLIEGKYKEMLIENAASCASFGEIDLLV